MENKKTIDERISNAVAEIEHHMKQLPVMPNPSILRYVFPQIEISDVTELIDGRKMAKITAHINKENMIYWPTKLINGKEVREEWKTHDSLNEYWDLGVKFQVIRPDIPNTSKAVILMQFRSNMEDNYSSTHEKTVNQLNGAVDELYALLVDKRGAENETDCFSNIDAIKIKDPKLKDTKKVTILNLLKGLVIDERNYSKIKQHEREGRFSKGEECVITLYRQIRCE